MLPPTVDWWKFWRRSADGGDEGDAEAAAPVAEEVGERRGLVVLVWARAASRR